MDRDSILANFHIVQDTMVYLAMESLDRNLVYEWNKYAEGLIGKSNLHLLAIRNIYEQGEWYSILSDRYRSYLIDPLSTATILRGMYESMLTLNHIYVNPPNIDELQLRYLLWALSTFISKDQATPAIFEEHQDQRNGNRQNLEDTVNYILSLEIVKGLDDASKRTIESKLAPRAGDGWEYYIDGVEFKRVKGGWHGLAERIPAKENVFNNLYKLFSLNSHSTWHSVNIVVNGFEIEDGEPENFRMMDTMLSTSSWLGAFIVYDYCMVFDEVRKAFDKLPTQYKESINFLLKVFKGEAYQL